MYTIQLAVTYWLLLYAASSAAGNDLGAQQITATPVLQARGAFQTAGFISGNPNSPITCPGTSTVSKGPEYAFGCCDQFTCWKPASCQTNGEPTCGPNCVYSQITRCTDEASPSCAEYVLKTSAHQVGGYTSFLCLPSSTVIIVFVTSTGGSESGPVATETSGVTSTGDSGSGPVVTETSGATAGSSTITSSSPTDTSVSSPTSTSVSSPTDTSGTSAGSSTTTGSSPVNTSGSSSDSGGGGGYTEDQKIELGVGIGVGVPAIFIPLLAAYLRHLYKKKKRAAASP